MPTYEYVCEKCGRQFETSQSITAKALTVCPKDKCARKKWGKGKVHRSISGGAGLLFKGSGFYITDYRSEGYKEAAKKDSGGAKESVKEPAAPTGKEGGSASKESGGKETAKPKETKEGADKKPAKK